MYRANIFVLLATGFLWLNGPARASNLSVEDLRKLQSEMKSGNYLSVDFEQNQFSALRKKNFKRIGKAQFEKPDKFRWMIETPEADYKIYNGKQLYDYKPSEKSAVRYSPEGGQAKQLQQIVDLVMNFDSLLNRYELVKATKEKGLVKVELKPKTSGEINRVDLHLNSEKQFISYLRLYLENGNHLTLEFKNPTRQALSSATFSFPKDVKITDSN